MKLVIDSDYIAFKSSSIAEDRSIKVTHIATGKEQTFKTRTEFYGNHFKKEGGWLAECNKGRKKPFFVDDFLIEDVQELKQNAMGVVVNSINEQISALLARLNTMEYYGYVSRGDSFRVELSTILKYKGNRVGMTRPLLLTEAKEYLIERHNCTWQEGLEADDQVIVDFYSKKSHCVVGVDKDFNGCEVRLFNPDSMTKPELIKGLGGLYLNGKREVKGKGRKWLWHQVLSGDSSDNYKANCASDMKWGEKSSFQLLDPCKTDKECLLALKEGFQLMYPEPKIITGWRGDEFEIDWLYVANECFQMARMRRWEGDEFHLSTVLDKLGIAY